MKEPKALEKYRKNYEKVIETAKEKNWDYPGSLEEYIRNTYNNKLISNRIGKNPMMKPKLEDILELQNLVEYFDTLSDSKTASPENKQGTARQLALAFYFMVQAKHLPKGTLDYTKNARFIEFLTGKSSENVRKKLGNIKGSEVTGVTSEKEIKNLINDLEKIKKLFNEVLFSQEVKYIDAYLLKLRNDLDSMSE